MQDPREKPELSVESNLFQEAAELTTRIQPGGSPPQEIESMHLCGFSEVLVSKIWTFLSHPAHRGRILGTVSC